MYNPAWNNSAGRSNQYPQYYFSKPVRTAEEKAASKARGDAQAKKHNSAQYADGVLGPDDFAQTVHLGWENFKTELYDNWSPVGNAIEWGAKNILPWNWFNKDTSWNSIRARSRDRYRQMEAADRALGDKYGFTPGQQLAIRIGAGIGANFFDPSSVALTLATGGLGAGVAAGWRAARAGKGVINAVRIANKTRKGVAAAKAARNLQRVYGGATEAAALANKANMGLLHRGWRNLTRFGTGAQSLGLEGLELVLAASTGADREQTVYRGNDGMLYQKDPEVIRSLYYKTFGFGGRSPHERALGAQNTAMLDYMARQTGQDAESLYSDLARQGLSPQQAYQQMMSGYGDEEE